MDLVDQCTSVLGLHCSSFLCNIESYYNSCSGAPTISIPLLTPLSPTRYYMHILIMALLVGRWAFFLFYSLTLVACLVLEGFRSSPQLQFSRVSLILTHNNSLEGFFDPHPQQQSRGFLDPHPQHILEGFSSSPTTLSCNSCTKHNQSTFPLSFMHAASPYHIASALLGRIEGVGGWETSIYMPNLSPTSTIQKCVGFPGKDFY